MAKKAATDLFSVNKFLARISATGIAKTNRFRLLISCPISDSEIITMNCESSEFPGKSLQTSQARVYGPAYKSPVLIEFQDINISVICDKSLSQKTFFDRWVDLVNPGGPSGYDFEYRDNYVGEITMQQYSEIGELTYECVLREAYPVMVNSLPANWADDQFHRVQIVLTYRYWEETRILPPSIKAEIPIQNYQIELATPTFAVPKEVIPPPSKSIDKTPFKGGGGRFGGGGASGGW